VAGANGATRWIGDEEKNVKMLKALADQFGEDSEAFADYVEQQRTAASLVTQSNLFREIGSGGSGVAGSPEAKLSALAKARQTANPQLSYEQAYSEVLASDDGARIYGEMPVRA
jgi:hypothetical protein